LHIPVLLEMRRRERMGEGKLMLGVYATSLTGAYLIDVEWQRDVGLS